MAPGICSHNRARAARASYDGSATDCSVDAVSAAAEATPALRVFRHGQRLPEHLHRTPAERTASDRLEGALPRKSTDAAPSDGTGPRQWCPPRIGVPVLSEFKRSAQQWLIRSLERCSHRLADVANAEQQLVSIAFALSTSGVGSRDEDPLLEGEE
jgi:hypothetical protein